MVRSFSKEPNLQQWRMSAQEQIHCNKAPVTMEAGGSSEPHNRPDTLEEVRTLWVGGLQYWVDDNYLNSCFSHTEQVLSVKIIRNTIAGLPAAYGFVEFVSHAAAERVLQAYNGKLMPGTEQTFRLNWAFSGIPERRFDTGPGHFIFVGGLAPDVTDHMLQETFRIRYSSVLGAKVSVAVTTGLSKGYGFVKFADEIERNCSMTEMNGVYCSSQPIRISAATSKKTFGTQQQYKVPTAIYPSAAYTPTIQTVPVANDVNSTTVLVGNLDTNITEEELRQIFVHFGEIVSIKIPPTRDCGFVQFTTRMSAEQAIQNMQGATIGQQAVHLSWGRSPISEQNATSAWGSYANPNQWSSANYGYGQSYDAYTYGMSQDPSYAYSGYSHYPQQSYNAHTYGMSQDPSYAYSGYSHYPQQDPSYAYSGYSHYPQQSYDAYNYGMSQDPSYAYAGYSHYPQEVEGSQEMSVLAGPIPAIEQKNEYDPLSKPDVDKLNASYLAVHGSAILGRPLWLRTSSMRLQS